MARYTKELRQQIIRDFAVRHNGVYNPALFLEEVGQSGPTHPAYDWFTWDDADAAKQHRLSEAREFARDLKVTFTVEEVGRTKAVTVIQKEAPFVMSPMDHRNHGGGYHLTDPSDPDHMAEFCKQAASGLEAWLRRYRAALEHAGGNPAQIELQVKTLTLASSGSEKAA